MLREAQSSEKANRLMDLEILKAINCCQTKEPQDDSWMGTWKRILHILWRAGRDTSDAGSQSTLEATLWRKVGKNF